MFKLVAQMFKLFAALSMFKRSTSLF